MCSSEVSCARGGSEKGEGLQSCVPSSSLRRLTYIHLSPSPRFFAPHPSTFSVSPSPPVNEVVQEFCQRPPATNKAPQQQQQQQQQPQQQQPPPLELLVRFQHLYAVGEDAVLSQPAVVDVAAFLAAALRGLTVSNVVETTLVAANVINTAPGTMLHLAPLQIRTFLVTMTPG